MLSFRPKTTRDKLQQLEKRCKKFLKRAQILSRYEERLTYECEAALLFKGMPGLVLLPKSTDEVAQIVQDCRALELSYIARGAGTGLSGGGVATREDVIISLAAMTQVIEIDVANRCATVEVGVINADLSKEAKPYGLYYAPDPSSNTACTIGGNLAENAGGIHCLKHGVTVDHVLGLEVVTPEGEVVWLGGKHGHSGPVNWVGLMVGSEGTLGIITKAILKLSALPNRTKVFLAAFSSTDLAATCVSDIIASGVQPAAMEFMDAFTAASVNRAFNVGFPSDAKAILLIELDGTNMEVEQHQKQILSRLQKYQAFEVREAEDEYERKQLWQCRKLAVASYGQYMPSFYLHDCVIPRSQLAPILDKIERIAKKHDVLIGNVFHAGDGNLHPNILFDPKDTAMLERALEAGEEIIKACLAVGGVLTGEHGVGLEKQPYMGQQYDDATLEAMAALKTVFDPQALCNPGKIIPQRVTCGEMRQPIAPPSDDKKLKAGVE